MSTYRGKGARATDGEKVWSTAGTREYVSSPLSYKPPINDDPVKALETPAVDDVDVVKVGLTWGVVAIGLGALLAALLVIAGIFRLLWQFASGG